MTPDQGFYEYEVSFDPLVESKSMRSILLKQHEEAIGYAKIFDGVTLHLPFDLKYNVRFPTFRIFFKMYFYHI